MPKMATSSTMYGTEASETTPATSSESVAAHALVATSDSASLVAHQSYEHTPTSSALGMPSISSVGVDTPPSGSFQLSPNASNIQSQASDRLSESVNMLLPITEISHETGSSVPLSEAVSHSNPLDVPAEINIGAESVREQIPPPAMGGFLMGRDDPFVMLIHPGNTRAYIDQSQQEMAERIDAMMAPFQGLDGL